MMDEDYESEFKALYMKVRDNIKTRFQVDDDAIRAALASIIESFHYERENRFSDVDYSRYENVCGYLSRYTVPRVCLTRDRVLEAVRNCEPLATRLRGQQQGELRVVSLGCGPGSDVVGFCSALHALDTPCRALHFTLVDVVREFGTCVEEVGRLVRNGDFGSVSKLFREKEVGMSFHQTDIRDAWRDVVYRGALRNADIILAPWVFSILRLYDIPRALQIILSTMKDKALLLYLDSSPVSATESGRLSYNNNSFFEEFDLLYLSPDEYENFSNSRARIAVLRKRQNATAENL